MEGALFGKPGSVMWGTGNQHGGQEASVLSYHTVLLHHGMVLVGLPDAYTGQMGHGEIRGGSPSGACVTTGGDGSRMPSKQDLEADHYQGGHL